MGDLEAIFRAQMRTLAHRGAAATKRDAEPGFYAMIGRIGGAASVAARKRRIHAEFEDRVCEPVPMPPPAPLEPSPQQAKKDLALADIFGDKEMLRQRGLLRE